MRIFNRELLALARQKHADAAPMIDAWLKEMEQAEWTRPLDIKKHHASASFLAGQVVIFNVKGNRYRLACGWITAAASCS